MWQLMTSFDAWAALLSLTALEVVLGIDNVVFISILVSRLDARRGETARRLGLALAVVFRIALLIGVALVADGFDFHIPRGYVYFAMAFAAAIEMFNIWMARRRASRRSRT